MSAESPDPQPDIEDSVLTELIGQVGVITLNDRRRRNALSGHTARAVVDALDMLRAKGS